MAVVLLLGGCSAVSDFFKPRPQALLPAADLYAQGEKDLDRSRYAEARVAFKKIVERHPQSNYAPRARFLIGESYYRESEWEKAIKEFETFLSFYPRHQIADLVQFRLAMSYYDQVKPVEQDQAITAKAMEAFKTLVREYPESRYAADALAKIDICRGRMAQKELFVASYYLNQGNRRGSPPAARERGQELSTHPRDPRGALPPRGSVRGRGPHAGGAGDLPSVRDRLLLHRMGPSRGPAAQDRGHEVIAVHDIVDLRSDTLTLPTPAMREAMARAEVGDDVWEEDPTVRRLEEQAARRMGKEAALFVSSGTQGNLVSILTQTRPGQEIILDADSHIFNYEVAGAAVFGGVQTLPLKTARGFLSPEQVREHLRPGNVHIPVTGLVCLENTHNRHGGTCCTPEEIEAVAAAAHGAGVPVHLDGARIFNAAVALGRSRDRLRATRGLRHLLPVQGTRSAGGFPRLRARATS